MRTFLYTRVSTEDQTTSQQVHAVRQAGYAVEDACVFTDEATSGKTAAYERPGFSAMMRKAMRGDRIIVAKLDRIGRSTADVLRTVERVQAEGVHLVVLGMDGMDLTGSYGKLVVTLLAAVSELERNLISERTKAKLAEKKAKGERVGGIPKVSGEMRSEMVERHAKGESMASIGERFGVSAMTVSRHLREAA